MVTRGFGSADRVISRGLALQCLAEDAVFFKHILTLITWDEIRKNAIFIPEGFVQMTSPETHKSYLTTNNQYLSTLAAISLVGMTELASQQVIVYNPDHLPEAEHITIKNYMLKCDAIMALEQTTRTDVLKSLAKHRELGNRTPNLVQ